MSPGLTASYVWLTSACPNNRSFRFTLIARPSYAAGNQAEVLEGLQEKLELIMEMAQCALETGKEWAVRRRPHIFNSTCYTCPPLPSRRNNHRHR